MELVLNTPPPRVGATCPRYHGTRNCRLGCAAAFGPRTFLLRAPEPRIRRMCGNRVRRRPGSILSMALPFDVSPDTAASAVAVTTLLGFATVRAVVYFQMQYIIAAMLSRHVPRGGAKVLDLSIHEGRNLYYYPKDTVQVVAVSAKPNTQLLERQGVPIVAKARPLDNLGMPSNSVDAVVSVYCLCDVADGSLAGVLREAVRILKPGKPFIIIENVGAKGQLVRVAQTVLESLTKTVGSTRIYSRDLLKYIQETKDLEDLEFEEVLDFQDPHLVGVAKKRNPAPPSAAGVAADGAGKKRSKR